MMTGQRLAVTDGVIFDGHALIYDHALCFDNDILIDLIPQDSVDSSYAKRSINGDVASPAYVDLQVNGGGGVMFNDNPSVEILRTIAHAHERLGTKTLLPTLITDTPEKTAAAIDATCKAVSQTVPGVAGLHLEGPHISVERKGAHDANKIRPMTQADVQQLIDASAQLPILKVTLAPENATPQQVRTLVQHGVLVALGHTNASFSTCVEYTEAGASCVTHLFNAMSQFGHREPGVVGAALTQGQLSAGLIADGIHVHDAAVAMAFHTKQIPGQLYLVTDAMAVAGSTNTTFHLNGRTVSRKDGRLTLDDGTLAGADLELTQAIAWLVNSVGISLEQALKAATSVPGKLINRPCEMQPGFTTLQSLIRIDKNLQSVNLLAEQTKVI